MAGEQILDKALAEFEEVFSKALSANDDPHTMMLSTADTAGRPSARAVSFTGLVEQAFTFLINEDSGKGQQLVANPWAALCFYWRVSNCQVVVEGKAARLDAETADQLWRSRPREAAFAAWASEQSSERPGFKERYAQAQQKFVEGRVPRPPHWTAFGLTPNRIEIWRGGWQHRRERSAFVESGGYWKKMKLNP